MFYCLDAGCGTSSPFCAHSESLERHTHQGVLRMTSLKKVHERIKDPVGIPDPEVEAFLAEVRGYYRELTAQTMEYLRRQEEKALCHVKGILHDIGNLTPEIEGAMKSILDGVAPATDLVNKYIQAQSVLSSPEFRRLEVENLLNKLRENLNPEVLENSLNQVDIFKSDAWVNKFKVSN
jgi:hypothetical protein